MVGVDPATVLFATSLATAVLGAVVSSLAYRGYRRNDSGAMLYLALAIVCLTVLPFLISYGLAPLVALSDAATLVGVLGATVAGLLAVLYSLEGT